MRRNLLTNYEDILSAFSAVSKEVGVVDKVGGKSVSIAVASTGSDPYLSVNVNGSCVYLQAPEAEWLYNQLGRILGKE